METTPPPDSFYDFGYRKKKKPAREDDPRSSRPFRKPYGGGEGGFRKSFGSPRSEDAGGGFRKPFESRRPYGPRAEGGDFRKPYGPRAEGEGGGFRKPYGPRKPYGGGFRHSDGPRPDRGGAGDRGFRKPHGPRKPYGDGNRPVWKKNKPADGAPPRESDGESRE